MAAEDDADRQRPGAVALFGIGAASGALDVAMNAALMGVLAEAGSVAFRGASGTNALAAGEELLRTSRG